MNRVHDESKELENATQTLIHPKKGERGEMPSDRPEGSTDHSDIMAHLLGLQPSKQRANYCTTPTNIPASPSSARALSEEYQVSNVLLSRNIQDINKHQRCH